jgi:hypothetical protein
VDGLLSEETEQIIRLGSEFGLKPKIHVNQFNSIGGGGCSSWWQNKSSFIDNTEMTDGS